MSKNLCNKGTVRNKVSDWLLFLNASKKKLTESRNMSTTTIYVRSSCMVGSKNYTCDSSQLGQFSASKMVGSNWICTMIDGVRGTCLSSRWAGLALKRQMASRCAVADRVPSLPFYGIICQRALMDCSPETCSLLSHMKWGHLLRRKKNYMHETANCHYNPH